MDIVLNYDRISYELRHVKYIKVIRQRNDDLIRKLHVKFYNGNRDIYDVSCCNQIIFK